MEFSNAPRDYESFRIRLEETQAIPSIPTVLADLLACLRNEESSTEEIIGLISQDSGLTARLLKLANSSAMGVRFEVTSIQRAVALLGRGQVRQICMGDGVWAALKPLAQKANFDLDAFELHSLVCAEIAQALATKAGKSDAEDVYSSALLHDIGKFILLAFEGTDYVETLKQVREKKVNLDDLELENHGWSHSQAGAWLTRHWGLPIAIQTTAQYHHHPGEVEDQNNRSIVSLVTIANNLIKALKIGDSGNPALIPIGALLNSQGLKPQDLEEIARKLKG
jgi:putative nucleotidyltransferase with HDIG domain